MARDDVYAYARSLGDETMIVILNASRAHRKIDLALEPPMRSDAAFEDVWARQEFRAQGGLIHDLDIPPRQGRVLRLAR
jgi:hypothetical protein